MADESTFLDTPNQEPLTFLATETGANGSGSEVVDNFDASKLALLKGAADSRDPMEMLIENKDLVSALPSTEEIYKAHAEELGSAYMAGAVEAASSLNAPESAAQAMTEQIVALTGPEKEWRAIELAVSNETDLITAEKMAYEAAMYKIGQMMAKSGTLDTIGDWGGALFFSTDALWDIPQFVKETGAASFQQFVDYYNQLPPVEKVKTFGAIADLAEKAFDDNQVKAANALLAILNPQTDSALAVTGMSYEAFEKTFSAVEALGWISTAVAVSRRMNAVRLAVDMGNKKLAGTINKGALEGHAASTVANVSQETAAGNTLAIDMGTLDPSITKGVAPDTIAAIELERENLFAILSELKQTNIERASLTPIEQHLAAQNALSKFGAWAADMERKGWVVENAKIVNQDKSGFQIVYDLDDPSGTMKVRPKPITVKYTFNDVGEYEAIEAGIGSTKLLSPSRVIEDIDPHAVDIHTAILPSQDKVIRIFQEAMQSTWRGLSKDERADLDNLLLRGDAQAKAYTIQELEMLGMNQKQVTAYYKNRDMLDVMHAIKNKTVRDEKTFQGWIGGKVTTVTDTGHEVVDMPVRPIGSGVLNERKITTVYDGTGSGTFWISTSSNKFEKMLDNTDDFVLVEFDRHVQVGKKSFSVGIIKKNKTGDLPENLLQKRDGYVPLVRKGVYYAVKSVRNADLDGRVQKVLSVERLFDDLDEATEWSRGFQERNPGVETRVLADAELTADDTRGIDIVNHGGLYGTPRTDKDILFGLDGASSDRISAVDAMARNMSHVANRLPMNQYRMGHIQRFINSFGKYLERPWDWNSAFKSDTPHAVLKGGEATRTFIKDLSRIPTPAEISWGWHMRKIGEFVSGKVSKTAGRQIANIGHTDPWAAMRATSFYLQLGFFRLDQLFVQSAGASIAMSIHPLLAPGAIADYMTVRYAHAMIGNPTAISRIEKMAGYKPGALHQLVEDWDKAGLMDAIRNNADYNAATLGLNIDAGMVSRITEAGLLPFKEGELFSQGIGWMIARTKYMKDRKLTKLSDADLDNVMAYSKTISLNLTRANRSSWQKGFWSLPTQFMQIQAKFFEQMSPAFMGGATKLSGAEKARVWAGQIFLFGVAGVPLFKYALNSALESAGYNPATTSEEVKAWMAGGLAEYMTQATFGQRFDVAGRMSIPSGVEQTLRDVFVYDVPVTDAALGAFGSVPHRAFQAFKNTAHLLKDPGAYEWNWDLVSTVGAEYATVMASFNNAHKAKTWYAMGHITDNQGRVLMELDPNTGTTLLVGKVLGFQPRIVSDYYDLKEWGLNIDKFNKQKVEAIRNLTMIHLSKNPDDPVNQRNYDTMMAVITADIPSEDARKAVIKEALSPMFDDDTALNRALRKYYQYAIDTGQMDSISGTISGSVGQSSVITNDEKDKDE